MSEELKSRKVHVAIGVMQTAIFMGVGAGIGSLFDATQIGALIGLATYVALGAAITAEIFDELAAKIFRLEQKREKKDK